MFDRNLEPDPFNRYGRCTGREQAKAILQMIAIVIALIITFIICLDLFGLIAWIGSGQVPQDGFYIGRITAEIIKFIINLLN